MTTAQNDEDELALKDGEGNMNSTYDQFGRLMRLRLRKSRERRMDEKSQESGGQMAETDEKVLGYNHEPQDPSEIPILQVKDADMPNVAKAIIAFQDEKKAKDDA